MSDSSIKHVVAVIGAGPAGIFAAKTLAEAGVHAVILNRDIKPGGLAEYGIYHSKHKMKEGLRKQFRGVLTRDDVDYFGFVRVGKEGGDIGLEDLRAMGFQGLLVTAGAQGTKWLGMPGEELRGVYHAKDVVYHYNRLPPFSTKEFHIGRRVAVVGIGNVMADLAHWLVHDKKVHEVIVVVRRGPGERKYDDKEIECVIANWDQDALKAEFARIGARLREAGQDPDALHKAMLAPLDRADPKVAPTRMRFEFLSSPAGIVPDGKGGMAALEANDTTIYPGPDGDMKTKNLGTTHQIACDAVIFAIGDRVDETLGLPYEKGAYAVEPKPRYPVEGISYEVPGWEDAFLAGWSRQASDGLVGVARRDGIQGAQAMLRYICDRPAMSPAEIEAVRQRLSASLGKLPHPVVDKRAWQELEKVEKREAEKHGLLEFKYPTNEEMLGALGLKGGGPRKS